MSSLILSREEPKSELPRKRWKIGWLKVINYILLVTTVS